MLLTVISTRHSNFLEAGILFGQLTRFVLFRFVLFFCFVCYVVRFSLSNLLGFKSFKELAPIPYSEISDAIMVFLQGLAVKREQK